MAAQRQLNQNLRELAAASSKCRRRSSSFRTMALLWTCHRFSPCQCSTIWVCLHLLSKWFVIVASRYASLWSQTTRMSNGGAEIGRMASSTATRRGPWTAARRRRRSITESPVAALTTAPPTFPWLARRCRRKTGGQKFSNFGTKNCKDRIRRSRCDTIAAKIWQITDSAITAVSSPKSKWTKSSKARRMVWTRSTIPWLNALRKQSKSSRSRGTMVEM